MQQIFLMVPVGLYPFPALRLLVADLCKRYDNPLAESHYIETPRGIVAPRGVEFLAYLIFTGLLAGAMAT